MATTMVAFNTSRQHPLSIRVDGREVFSSERNAENDAVREIAQRVPTPVPVATPERAQPLRLQERDIEAADFEAVVVRPLQIRRDEPQDAERAPRTQRRTAAIPRFAGLLMTGYVAATFYAGFHTDPICPEPVCRQVCETVCTQAPCTYSSDFNTVLTRPTTTIMGGTGLILAMAPDMAVQSIRTLASMTFRLSGVAVTGTERLLTGTVGIITDQRVRQAAGTMAAGTYRFARGAVINSAHAATSGAQLLTGNRAVAGYRIVAGLVRQAAGFTFRTTARTLTKSAQLGGTIAHQSTAICAQAGGRVAAATPRAAHRLCRNVGSSVCQFIHRLGANYPAAVGASIIGGTAYMTYNFLM